MRDEADKWLLAITEVLNDAEAVALTSSDGPRVQQSGTCDVAGLLL